MFSEFGPFCDKKPVHKIAGGISGAHCLKSLEIGEEVGAEFCRQRPERFVLDDLESNIPAFCTVLCQYLTILDLKAAGN
jgi:hypothetical protein